MTHGNKYLRHRHSLKSHRVHQEAQTVSSHTSATPRQLSRKKQDENTGNDCQKNISSCMTNTYRGERLLTDIYSRDLSMRKRWKRNSLSKINYNNKRGDNDFTDLLYIFKRHSPILQSSRIIPPDIANI